MAVFVTEDCENDHTKLVPMFVFWFLVIYVRSYGALPSRKGWGAH